MPIEETKVNSTFNEKTGNWESKAGRSVKREWDAKQGVWRTVEIVQDGAVESKPAKKSGKKAKKKAKSK